MMFSGLFTPETVAGVYVLINNLLGRKDLWAGYKNFLDKRNPTMLQ